MNAVDVETVSLLRQRGRRRAGDLTLVGADLRGADLAGARLAFVNLAHTRLDGADLSGARLDQVVLTGAQLTGARLTGANLTLVEATEATFADCDATGSTWTQSTLLRADLRGARLRTATFVTCRLEAASFAGADLARASVLGCPCDEADFAGAELTGLETSDSTFRRAGLRDARRFAMCREIIAEVLRRDLDADDNESMMLIGAVLAVKGWCYDDWKAYLSTPDMLGHYATAVEILAGYPHSGAREALEAGRSWRR